MIIKILASLTVIAQISFVVVLAVMLFRNKLPRAYAMLARWAMPLAFAVALVAASGSLYLSEIAGFQPCDLCWFQRIFMYPQAILLGLALLKRENTIIDYCLALLGIGLVISLYHNYIVYQAVTATFCSAAGEVSCTQQYIVEYGYITIPMMALTAFVTIIALLWLRKSQKAEA
jgi:disulfide bond formation protein DsbB